MPKTLHPRFASLLSTACLIAAAAALQAGCESEKKTEAPQPTPVTVAEVTKYTGNEGVTYSASLVPYEQLPVAFKSAGYVESILQRKGVDGRMRNLQQGDYVKRGEVLATVRQSDYEHAVEQYKGQLVQAQAAAVKAKEDFARAQALYNAQALTQTDYDAAKAQLDSTQGTLITAQAGVKQAQQSLSDCQLRAPSAGQILQRNIELGSLVGTGTAGFTMGDTARVKALFGIPDTVLSTVTLGKKQGIQTETYNQTFMGQITAVSPQADQKSRTFQVEVTVPNDKDLLRSGMVATLLLDAPKSSSVVLVVPLAAVVSPADGAKTFTVFVVAHEDGKDVARRRTVEPGPAYGNQVAILKGVSLGDRVLLNGATIVTDGQPIRVLP
jgi:RND family efflux transporter MFP subunit